MKKTSEPIVFFGSGPVAAASLRLLAQDFKVEAVVTKPSTVHEMAGAAKGAKVYSVNTKTELDSLADTKPFTSELAVLIDFGIIVSQKVIDYFPLGIINSHFSLLPKLRGADPITFSILNGDKETGVSLMLLVAAMDEGPLLAQQALPIPDDITTPELTDRLIDLSYRMLRDTVPKYAAGEIQPIPQPQEGATYSRKLTKEDGVLDWEKPAEQLEREIRAFISWPKSRTKLGNVEVIITKAHAVPVNHPGLRPGDITTMKEGVVMVECGTGYLCIDELKPVGKKEMTGKAFLAGYKKQLLP